jgi:hypothetical protein
MSNEDPPKLTVAAETAPHELEKAQAARELAWVTKEMAANMLRVIRGAGRPLDLPQQIINLAEDILEVSKSARVWAVSSAIEEALQSANPDWEASESDYYEGMIASGAMQWVASRLVRQRAQECAGAREMAEGFKQQERWVERQRQKFWEEQARVKAEQLEARRQKRAKARAAKPKPPPSPPEPPTPAEEPDRPSSTAEFMKARRKQMRSED